MRKSNWVVIIIFVVMIFGVCMMIIDVSIPAIKYGGILTNGFQEFDPMQMYHISLYLAMICMLFISMIAVHHLRLDEGVK